MNRKTCPPGHRATAIVQLPPKGLLERTAGQRRLRVGRMGGGRMGSSIRQFRRHDPHLVAEALSQRLAVAMCDLEGFPEPQSDVDRANRQKAKEVGA